MLFGNYRNCLTFSEFVEIDIFCKVIHFIHSFLLLVYKLITPRSVDSDNAEYVC